ncbi:MULTISPECIES: glucose-6-phosphate dehydrogenase [Streptomyces]|uniref:Glucose-6-phosphate 1-dehydrogenase n=2 Tax=Streptomyces TaxID=1883 RepID=A0ABV9IUX5_9ACTN
MSDPTAPRAGALVLFGITGDLARKMLLPALYQLARRGALTEPVVGVTRGGWTLDRLRRHAHDAVAAQGPVDEDAFTRFSGLLRLATIDYDDPGSFRSIAEQTAGCGHLAHYLAIPPVLYARAATCLAGAGLNENARLVVEKPFGHDLVSARELQSELTKYFPEERLRRVDHFLGKDVVEDLLTFRFANTLMRAVLDRHHVRSVQVTMAEDFDVADRGGFYDAVGCLRDVVQNHLLQTLAYFVMEAPRSGSAADTLTERARALKAVRTVRPEDYVRGRYAGYLDTEGVKPDSTTETYAALRTYVDTDRWSGVPFTIRAGKDMETTSTEIVVELDRPVPGHHHTQGAQTAGPNLVRFRLMPRSGVTFSLLAQHGGDGTLLDEVTVTTDFTRLTGSDTSAYEHILEDSLTGDPRRFCRMDMVEECWRIVGGLLTSEGKPVVYRPGSWGPAEADRLVTDERWFPLENV